TTLAEARARALEAGGQLDEGIDPRDVGSGAMTVGQLAASYLSKHVRPNLRRAREKEINGAGRPIGSKNKRTAELARAAAESGITPIEVMLGTMYELWAQGTPEAKREAAEIAKDAAPYIHPRLASIDQTIKEHRPFAVVPGQLSIEGPKVAL